MWPEPSPEKKQERVELSEKKEGRGEIKGVAELRIWHVLLAFLSMSYFREAANAIRAGKGNSPDLARVSADLIEVIILAVLLQWAYRLVIKFGERFGELRKGKSS